MTTLIQSSRLRAAAHYIPELIIGSAFPALYALAIGPSDQIPAWFKAVFGLAAVAGLALVFRALFRMARVLSAQGTWKASITQDRLIWQTALPARDFPLDVALSDIAEAVQLRTYDRGSDDDLQIATTYELRFTDGSVRTFAQEDCGIDPDRVFQALKEHGVLYRPWKLDRTEDPSNTTRVVDHTD